MVGGAKPEQVVLRCVSHEEQADKEHSLMASSVPT